MNITWTAIPILLAFVTPAIWPLAFLRLFIPKADLISPRDLFVILFGCILNLFVNPTVFGRMAQGLLSSFSNSDLSTNQVDILLLNQLLAFGNYDPYLPGTLFVTKVLGWQVSPSNFFCFLFDLNIRVFIFIIIILTSIWLFKQIEKRTTSPIPLNVFRFIRASFYHPWAILTEFRKGKELLMADVLTLEGNFYSGHFVSFMPKDNGISAIALKSVLRFYPQEEFKATSGQNHNELEAKNKNESSDPLKSFETRSSGRRKVLVKNGGELVIPESQLATLNFWKIRRGFIATVAIKNSHDVEILKWNLILAYTTGFFAEVRVEVTYVEDDKAYLKFTEELISWILTNSMESLLDKVQVVATKKIDNIPLPIKG